jgi:hypothetical protein
MVPGRLCRTAGVLQSLMSLNLAGKGGLPMALQRSFGWSKALTSLKVLGGLMKFDPGFIAGDALSCLIDR